MDVQAVSQPIHTITEIKTCTPYLAVTCIAISPLCFSMKTWIRKHAYITFAQSQSWRRSLRPAMNSSHCGIDWFSEIHNEANSNQQDLEHQRREVCQSIIAEAVAVVAVAA